MQRLVNCEPINCMFDFFLSRVTDEKMNELASAIFVNNAGGCVNIRGENKLRSFVDVTHF